MLLLRHASAGERFSSRSLDRARPLDGAGRVDARLLPEALAGYAIERIVTSPHVRCVESVRALAAARGLDLEQRDELVPEAPAADSRSLLETLSDTTLVCTHREVIERLFGESIACAKGAFWVLERRAGRWQPAEYVPPPSTAGGSRASAALG